MAIARDICCRECGFESTVVCDYEDLPLDCEECGSDDTYAAVGAVATSFIHRADNYCGWSDSGYTHNKVINLGDPSPSERADALEQRQNQMDEKRAGTWKEPGK